MEILTKKNIINVYIFICFAVTLSLSIYSFSRYLKDEDSVSLMTTKFHSSNDAMYPSLSFCIGRPFLKSKFHIYEDNDINETSYRKFLEGNLWNEKMLLVNYDDVTVSLEGNILNAYMRPENSDRLTWSPDYYVSFRSSDRKCFTITTPMKEHLRIFNHGIYINNDIFPYGKRSKTRKFYIYFH